MYCKKKNLVKNFVIVIVIRNICFSINQFLIFDEIEIEKTIAFFVADITLTLFFFKFRFVNNVSIANQRDFVFFFNESVDV